MKKDIKIFESNYLANKILKEILDCNEMTKEYGLKLSEKDVKEIVSARNSALKKCGRIEFNGEIVTKIIKNFADSPYIYKANYVDTISELIEIFYNYKNETLDYLSDDELITIMKRFFDGYCEGSLELLEGKILYKIADNIRGGVKDYLNLDDEKDW
ncbi:hypothetical protein SAMN04487886_10948 [Clostridium sp. DSM 8431]|uniref:DUF6323 family protein n=1 Tax=Clostridium sp. DSM 8431 TaxID=1761781 RepID=UPI0008E3FA77|nr:DUF6323 family protein [Clostridium sp. DSM 8431]SFU66806.1 hypothetical protein SAMN04487886_10948 [Clostridium sp. DSM 8431]